MALISEKLTPVAALDRGKLPAWIEDVGTDDANRVFVMTARAPDGTLLHCDVSMDGLAFDETFWHRYAEPMVNNLGGAMFEAEWPDMFTQSVRWEVEAAIGRRDLNALERQIIDRRKELTWTASALVD